MLFNVAGALTQPDYIDGKLEEAETLQFPIVFRRVLGGPHTTEFTVECLHDLILILQVQCVQIQSMSQSMRQFVLSSAADPPQN